MLVPNNIIYAIYHNNHRYSTDRQILVFSFAHNSELSKVFIDYKYNPHQFKMQIRTAMKTLTDREIYTFSGFPKGDNQVERSITNTHSAFNNKILRRNYVAHLTGDPLTRFVFLGEDNLLKVIYCSVLFENRFFEDDESILLLAFMGDDFTERQLVRLPETALNDIVACVASDATCKALDIVASQLDVTQMWKEKSSSTKINPTTDLEWPSTDYPHNCCVTLMPKVLCLPPHFEAFHGHAVTNEFGDLQPDQALWKYHEPWRKVLAYATQGDRKGLSVHVKEHPVFDEANWPEGEGLEFLKDGGTNLHHSFYTEYETVDMSSEAGRFALSMINPNLERALQFGINALPPTVDIPTPRPAARVGDAGGGL